MGKITLNEALKKASVKNDLQMFLGLDAQSELGGMTPERLAAVAGGLNSEPIMIDTVAQLDSFMQTGTANVSAKLSFEESEVYNGSLFSVNVKGKVGNGKNIIQFFFGAPGLFARYYLYDKWSRWIKIYSAE